MRHTEHLQEYLHFFPIQHRKRNYHAQFLDQPLRQAELRYGRRVVGEHIHACVRLSIVPVGPLAVHSSRRDSLQPSTGKGMAPSVFDPGELGTELVLTPHPPPPMLGLFIHFRLSTPRGSDLAFVGPPMLNGASAVGASDIDCAALLTGTAARDGAESTARGKMDSS